MLMAIVRVMFKDEVTQWTRPYVLTRNDGHFEHGAPYIRAKNKWGKPKYVHICTMAEYLKDMRPEDETAPDLKGIVELVMQKVKMADKKAFRKVAGDGFSYGFEQGDGSIGVGYRLYARDCTFSVLEVSLCHIYYGK